MAQTADSVVVEVEARLNAASARSAEAQFDQSMNKITGSAGKAEKAVTDAANKMDKGMGAAKGSAARLGVQIGQLGSSLGSGMSPMVVFAQQASDFAYVLNGTAGIAGRVAAFFSGPWGAALLAGGIVVSQLASSHKEHAATLADLTEKLRANREQTILNEQADRVWQNTIEGLTDAIRKRREEQEKALETDVQAEQESLRQAQHDLSEARKKQADLQRQISDTQARLAQLRNAPQLAGTAGQTNETAIATAEARLHRLQGQALTQLFAINQAEREQNAVGAQIGAREVEGKLDPAKAATDAFARAQGDLNERLAIGLVTLREYNAELLKAATTRDAALKAARDAKKGTDDDLTTFQRPVTGGTITGHVGDQRPGHIHAGVDIAVPIGTSVRAPAGGVIIESGEVQGYGQAIYIDHGRGTITRLGHLSRRDVSVGQTVEAGQVIGLSGNTGHSSGPHLHYEVRQGGRAVDPFKQHPTDFAASAGKAQQLQDREAELAARQDAAFGREMRDLQEQLVAATRERVTSMAQQLEIDQQQIATARDNDIASYEEAAAQHRITEAQAQKLIALRKQVADAKTAQLVRNEELRQAEASRQLNITWFADKLAEAQFQQEIAKTADQRRAAALAVLTAEQNLERAKLNEVLASEKIGSLEYQRAQLRLQQLDVERGRAEYKINTDPRNLSPAQAYAQGLQQTAGEINDSIEAIAVDGLKSLNDELTNAIMGTESLGDVFQNVAKQIIAALIKIAIQQAIIKPLSQLLGGDPGSGGGGGFFASLGSLFGGGGSGDGLFGPGYSLSGGSSFASGGSVVGGQPILVGEQGPEIWTPPTNGQIVPNHALASLGVGGGRSTVEVHVVGGEYFDARVVRVTGPVIARASVQAAQGGSTLARRDLARTGQNRLE